MNAKFILEGSNDVSLVIEPAWGIEAMLMATFIRYDSNIFHVSVERSGDGSIKSVTFIAESGQ